MKVWNSETSSFHFKSCLWECSSRRTYCLSPSPHTRVGALELLRYVNIDVTQAFLENVFAFLASPTQKGEESNVRFTSIRCVYSMIRNNFDAWMVLQLIVFDSREFVEDEGSCTIARNYSMSMTRNPKTVSPTASGNVRVFRVTVGFVSVRKATAFLCEVFAHACMLACCYQLSISFPAMANDSTLCALIEACFMLARRGRVK